jgi:hypothetical protein
VDWVGAVAINDRRNIAVTADSAGCTLTELITRLRIDADLGH